MSLYQDSRIELEVEKGEHEHLHGPHCTDWVELTRAGLPSRFEITEPLPEAHYEKIMGVWEWMYLRLEARIKSPEQGEVPSEAAQTTMANVLAEGNLTRLAALDQLLNTIPHTGHTLTYPYRVLGAALGQHTKYCEVWIKAVESDELEVRLGAVHRILAIEGDILSAECAAKAATHLLKKYLIDLQKVWPQADCQALEQRVHDDVLEFLLRHPSEEVDRCAFLAMQSGSSSAARIGWDYLIRAGAEQYVAVVVSYFESSPPERYAKLLIGLEPSEIEVLEPSIAEILGSSDTHRGGANFWFVKNKCCLIRALADIGQPRTLITDAIEDRVDKLFEIDRDTLGADYAAALSDYFRKNPPGSEIIRKCREVLTPTMTIVPRIFGIQYWFAYTTQRPTLPKHVVTFAVEILERENDPAREQLYENALQARARLDPNHSWLRPDSRKVVASALLNLLEGDSGDEACWGKGEKGDYSDEY